MTNAGVMIKRRKRAVGSFHEPTALNCKYNCKQIVNYVPGVVINCNICYNYLRVLYKHDYISHTDAKSARCQIHGDDKDRRMDENKGGQAPL